MAYFCQYTNTVFAIIISLCLKYLLFLKLYFILWFFANEILGILLFKRSSYVKICKIFMKLHHLNFFMKNSQKLCKNTCDKKSLLLVCILNIYLHFPWIHSSKHVWVQTLCPSPIYPLLHWHLYAPGTFIHVALEWQSSRFRLHSSMSGHEA